MELKSESNDDVLIWVVCSNRTFMELKFRIRIVVGTIQDSSNRTFMELKSTATPPAISTSSF